MGGVGTILCGYLVEAAGVGAGFATDDKYSFYLGAQFLQCGLALACGGADCVHDCDVFKFGGKDFLDFLELFYTVGGLAH